MDGLIAQRKQHLQQLDDLLKSVFLEMFGDPVRNEKGWDKPELKAFGKISTGNTPPRNDPANYDDDFIEWIKTDNITGDAVFVTPSTEHLSEFGARKARTLTNGALLVACIAGSVESIGRAALTDRTVSFNQQINAIQPGADVNLLYLYGLFKLCRAYLQSHATKGMKKILTKGEFEQITMIKPPLDFQNQFGVISKRIEGIKSRYQQSLTELEVLYGALSQKAFKGELDLSRVPLPIDQGRQINGELVEQQAYRSPLPEEAVTPTAVINDLVQATQLQGRGELLARWFSQYLTNTSPDASLGSAQLLEAAWQTVQETRLETDGETPALTLDDYDALKDWVFKALASGELNQRFDTNSNRVALQKLAAN
ncbi:MAG: type I restriction endonuclease [Burkholderiales bacterium RIFCSPLOWO2_12_FULL_61_40]|nr:MAG: type I restriction endonuclease [Burkholderiales bacterium RIFCSPLOWO2_12_FULL_61_40]